ncbi:MAG: sce7725 family protein [Limimaricola sp.]|uniref:sce7725 family protein n=1 Tax=Limimaricola sp. TaxID=2211665 RepID=UPI001DB94E17|nr:sce7725 family protein [Limimaricola sp.]MBI1418782.1 sce7725 family protein [Limimaricola sp.]
MYHPYFRGKQYELITIRENANLLAGADFIPIIEPVKEALNGLGRALTAVGDAGGSAVVIVNPHHGDHADDGERIIEFLQDGPIEEVDVSPAVLLKEQCTVDEAVRLCGEFEDDPVTLVHAGFANGAALADALGARVNDLRHVFLEDSCGRLYRRHFQSDERVLLRDGFERRRNRDHPPVEFFSDLHVTFAEEGMSGFGDFLTVGDDFSETGGPAYAIAVHLTFIDPAQDDAMFVRHFLSVRQDTPTDPAGKFAEALAAMIEVLDRGDSPILETNAVQEFRQLHADRHYPGLGYVKKLSMQHHIETLADYFEE